MISEVKNNTFETVAELPNNIFYFEPIVIKGKDKSQKLYFQSLKKRNFRNKSQSDKNNLS